MAVKKQVPAKRGKVVVKPAAKKIIKAVPPLKKKVVKPVAVNKNAKKQSVKAPVVKKGIKAVAKPLKKTVAVQPTKVVPAKKAIQPGVKKPVVKKSVLVKKVNVPVKVNVKEKAKAPVKAVKPALKSMAKKEVVTKVAAKPAAKEVTIKPAVEVKSKDIKVPVLKPVVMPKIFTKTVRKYEPDFTKSVLDKAKVDPGAPTLRYSDAELVEFRELIQRKLEAAKKELSYLHGLITRKDEMGGDEGDNRYMTMEDGSLSMEREQLSQMASRQITFIDHLEKAIMRIENKTYGICRVTGKLIDKARLRAVPHATLSIEAKMSSSK